MDHDPLLRQLHKLRVTPTLVDEHDFKLAALDALRSSNVYKRLKLKAAEIQRIEKTLVQDHITPLVFVVLCALYAVDVAVVQHDAHFICGSPTRAVRGDQIFRIPDLSDSFLLNPIKPLHAVSYYTLPELQRMAELLHVEPAKRKADLYASITTKVDSLLKN